MAEYIRRQTVYNPDSDRELRIWNWIVQRTGEFKKQNYAAFVRDKLEWCMLQENGAAAVLSEIERVESLSQEPAAQEFTQPREMKITGWASLA